MELNSWFSMKKMENPVIKNEEINEEINEKINEEIDEKINEEINEKIKEEINEIKLNLLK